MQPILDSFENDHPSTPWNEEIERQGVLVVITVVLFSINILLIAIAGQTNDAVNTIMFALLYIMGNIAVLLFGYFFFKIIINLVEQLLKLIKLDFLIHPFNLNFITFACFFNAIICIFLLYWILSIP